LKKIDGFDVAGYVRRLRLLREIVSGENQTEFAGRLGIPFKRWSNYERGYPVPRETAFILMKAFPGISVEWLWFGMTGNLSNSYAEKIKRAEQLEKEQRQAARALEKAQARVKDAVAKRKKAIYPAARR
jgi:transcriptional regulator with XRE-family HTH domain